MILKPRLFRKLRKGHWATKGLKFLMLSNEGSGNKVFDLSENGRNLDFVNSPIWTSGKFGSAILFNDGSSQYLLGQAGTVISEPFTLVAWGSSNDLTISQQLLSIGDADGSDYHAIRLQGNDPGDYARATSWDGSAAAYAESTKGFSLNTWHQVCGVFRAVNNRECYLDGGNKGINIVATATVTDADRVAIGITADITPVGPFSGKIGLAMIYNRALSEREIAELYREPFGMFERDSIGLWVGATSVGEVGGINYEDLLLGVSVSTSISKIDTQQMLDTEKDASIAASISKADNQQMLDTLKDVSIIASVSEEDILSGVVNYEDLLLGVSVSASVLEADTQQMLDTDKVVSATVDTNKAFTTWFNLNGTDHLVSDCGGEDLRYCFEALDGTDSWQHTVDHDHEFILDLGKICNIKNLRGRSFAAAAMDPIKVTVYISLTNGNWGNAVATDIATWQDTASWQEVDSTDKEGRFVKVVITETEAVYRGMIWGRSASPFKIFDIYADFSEKGIDTHQMLDTGKDVSIAASISKTDISAMIDTGKLLSVNANASKVDTQQMLDTDKALSIAASVSKTDTKQMFDTGLGVTVEASVSVTDTKTFLELGLTVLASASAVGSDIQQMKDLLKTLSVDVSVAKTDTQQMKDLLKALSIDASAEVGYELYTEFAAALMAMYAFVILRQHTN